MAVLLPPQHDGAFLEFLEKARIITPVAAKQIHRESEESGKCRIAVACDGGFVTEKQAAEGLAKHFSVSFAELRPPRVAAERPLRETLTVQQLMRMRMIPFALDGNVLSLAVSDPFALETAKKAIARAKQTALVSNPEELKEGAAAGIDFAKYDTQIYVTTLSFFEQYLAACSALEAPKKPQAPAGGAAGGQKVPSPRDAVMAALSAREMQQKKGPKRTFTSGNDIIAYVNELIKGASDSRSSDIHVERFEKTARIRYRCDGVLREVKENKEFLFKHYSSIVTRIKILAQMDISERRLPQDGGISFEYDGLKTDIRVSVLPVSHGERVVMRIIDQKASQFRIDDLGMEDFARDLFKKAVYAPQGMVLVTGPTGSGKSTTLYAALKERNTEDINIMTAEDPVEFDLEGIGQVKVRDDIGLTFSSALRSFLRQDPEMIMVGEIRDKDTCDIAVKAALTGHLVLSTLHTNDAPGTITRLLNMGVPPFLLTASVTLILAQRLVRKICVHCKTEDTRDPRERMLAIGFTEEETAGVTPMTGTGCDECEGTGSRGRMAVHEVLHISQGVKAAILENKNEIELRDQAKRDGFKTMQEVGRLWVKRGELSLQEFQRVIMPD